MTLPRSPGLRPGAPAVLIAALVFLALPGVCGAAQPVAGEGAKETAEKIQTAISGLAGSSTEVFWDRVRALESLGPAAAAGMEGALAGADLPGRLALSRALASAGRHEPAFREVEKVLKDKEAREADRLLSAEILRAFPPAFGPRLKGAVPENAAPRLRLAVERTLWHLLKEETSKEAFRTFLRSPAEEVRLEAAVALAEAGDLDTPYSILKILSKENSFRGAYVRSLIENHRLRDAMAKHPETNHPLIDQLLERINRFYVDEDRTDDPSLLVAAARGMVASLDRFSMFLDEKEWAHFKEQLSGTYGGIGAVLSGQGGYFTIVSAIYTGPAYKAGLRSRDRLFEVDGKPLRGLTLEDLVKLLKGKEGTKVKLLVQRSGWSKPREFEIKRGTIVLPTVNQETLPGGIGYIRILSFGEKTGADFKKALKALADDKAEGILLDLRDNPGGLLDEAVGVAANFLDKGKLVVYSEGRDEEIAPRKNHFVEQEREFPAFPMVVLINNGTASAAEIVAGALRDHQAAQLVGEKTYGKGSVQQLLELEAPFDKMRLRLTVAKYYLPLGSCIHEVGIEPEVPAKPRDIEIWMDDEYRALSGAGAFSKYVEERRAGDAWKEMEKAAAALPGHPIAPPGFDAWFASLKTHAPAAEVKEWLRRAIRDAVAEERGREFVMDLYDDTVLQTGVVELLKKLGKDPKGFPSYARLSIAAAPTPAPTPAPPAPAPPPEPPTP